MHLKIVKVDHFVSRISKLHTAIIKLLALGSLNDYFRDDPLIYINLQIILHFQFSIIINALSLAYADKCVVYHITKVTLALRW